MDLSVTHIHLLLNHGPTVGSVIGLALLTASIIWKHENIKRAALVLLVGIAILTIPTYTTGNAAQDRICGPIDQEGPCTITPELSRNLIEQHEGAALWALLLMTITGGVAWMSLWKARRKPYVSGAATAAVLVLGLLTLGAVSRAAEIGGEIRHPEIRVTGDTTELPFARLVGNYVRDTPWTWVACETLHFIGLTMIIGVVLLIDLRVLGLLKGVPFRALERLVPWAILGFGLNTTTGMLFFAAAAHQYVTNPAFNWKLVFILLASVNTLYFTFDRGWTTESDHEVPILTRAVAVSALACWVGVMYWGSMLPFIGNAF